MERLDYLDLEFYEKNNFTIKTSKYKHKCYFNKTYTHTLHSSESHLNSLTDLILSLGKSFELYHEKYDHITRTIARSIGEKNKIILDLRENQQFLKTQIEGIHVKLKELEHVKKLRQNHKKMISENNKTILNKIDKRAVELEQQYKDITILLDNLKRLTLGEKL